MSGRSFLAGAGAGVALAVALVVGTALGWWTSSPAGAAPARQLVVRTSLTPHPAFFGDLVVAEVEVQVDAAAVDARSIRVVPSFVPFVPVGAPEVSRSRVGRHETVRYRYGIQCLADDCLPQRRDPLVVQFGPVAVTASASGRQLQAKGTWLPTAILSRLQRKDIGSFKPHFRRPSAPPAASYAVRPGLLADGLTAAAGVLALAALSLLARELGRLLERRRRSRLVELTPLEAALAYTRDAARRDDPADRRKALELLAKTLEDEGVPALADTAGAQAWSEEPPSPDRALELADEVEGATRNGR